MIYGEHNIGNELKACPITNFWRYWIIVSTRSSLSLPAQLTVCSFQPLQFQELKEELCQVSVLVAMCLFRELVDFSQQRLPQYF